MRNWLCVVSFVVVACTDQTSPDGPFVETAAKAGLQFWHESGATGAFYLPEITGSGVALIDYDLDGDLDIFFAQGGILNPDATQQKALRPPPGPNPAGNRLFRNDLSADAALQFTDVTSRVGQLGHGFAMGAAVGDIDNDGDDDLFITGVGDDALLRNDAGHFVDITTSAGVADSRWNASASFTDYDGDGDLDLFVTAYVSDPVSANRVCRNQADQTDYCSPSNFAPLPDRLYQNDGTGHFSDVSAAAGIAASSGAGLGVVAADFDLDGAIDFYVANDQTANHLWRNRGDGTFDERALMAGAAYNADGRAEASMGLTSGDFDGDGDEDLFMTHLNTETNTLYRNDGSGNFSDATDRANLGAGSLQYTGWGALWFDVDHDRDLDLYIANGAVMQDAAQSDTHPYGQRNQLWLNEAGRFVVVDGAGVASDVDNSRGAAFGDLDNDGDIDVVVNNNDGPARLYLNQTDTRNHWLGVVLRDQTGNGKGIGARVAIIIDGLSAQWRRVGGDGSFASANDTRLNVGLGSAKTADIAVIWPGGRRERWSDIDADQYVLLIEGSGEPWQ